MSDYGNYHIAGSTDVSIPFDLFDSAGDPIDDAVAADLTIKIAMSPTSTPSTLSLSDLGSVSASHSDGGVIHVVNGRYRLDLPDSAVASAWNLIVSVEHADCKKNWIEPVVSKTVATLNDLTAAAVNAEVDTALADYNAPTKAELDAAVATLASAAALGDVDTVVDAIKAKTDLITAGSVTVSSPVSTDGTTTTWQAGDTWAWSLSGLGDLTDRADVVFAIFAAGADADAEALILIGEVAGLERLAGAAAGDASQASLTVTNESTGALALVVADEATLQVLAARNHTWAVKRLMDDGTSRTLAQGRGIVLPAVIRETAP